MPSALERDKATPRGQAGALRKNFPATRPAEITSAPLTLQQQLLFTAIPASRLWRLKAVAPNGAVTLGSTIYANRHEALGAGVIGGGRVGNKQWRSRYLSW
jgi:hypothetical protein